MGKISKKNLLVGVVWWVARRVAMVREPSPQADWRGRPRSPEGPGRRAPVCARTWTPRVSVRLHLHGVGASLPPPECSSVQFGYFRRRPPHPIFTGVSPLIWSPVECRKLQRGPLTPPRSRQPFFSPPPPVSLPNFFSPVLNLPLPLLPLFF